MTHDDLRAVLQALTNDALLARAIADITLARRYPDDLRAGILRDQTWMECCRRNREDIWKQALDAVRAEKAARAERNRMPPPRPGNGKEKTG